jgi:hypothetical protein
MSPGSFIHHHITDRSRRSRVGRGHARPSLYPAKPREAQIAVKLSLPSVQATSPARRCLTITAPDISASVAGTGDFNGDGASMLRTRDDAGVPAGRSATTTTGLTVTSK